MEIKTTGYKVVDDKRVIYLLSKTKDLDNAESERLIREFFETFTITSAYKEPAKPEKTPVPEKALLAKARHMSIKERISHIDDLPQEFTALDYQKRLSELGCSIKSYTAYNDLNTLIQKRKIEKSGQIKTDKKKPTKYIKKPQPTDDEIIRSAKETLAKDRKVKEAVIREVSPL